MKIAHLADIHIRPVSYLDELNYTFERLYESLRDEKVDVIALCGDIFHSKITVTNEYFVCCFNFLKTLTDIAPTVVIPGNHDLALANTGRLDSIAPVVEAVSRGAPKNKIHYLRGNETCTPIENSPFVFYHFSILDSKKKWFKGVELDKDLVNIALYHGSLNGSVVDSGWTSRGNKDDADIFDGFDFAFLGDIHKFQMINSRVAYPGSLRQNNFGESEDKGYIVWNIKDSKVFSSDHIILPQLRYFYTISLSSVDVPSDLNVKKDSRIRVSSQVRFTISEEILIREKIKELYSPCNEVPIIYDDRTTSSRAKTASKSIKTGNLRDVEVQKKMLEKYFENENLEEGIIENIFEINKKYNDLQKDALRNVTWEPVELKWSNIFAYGPKNKILFKDLSGINGIFGNNGVGKSSIIDAFCYCMFNSINKVGANKNIDYINNKKKKASVSLSFMCGNKKYFINRSTLKNGNKAINEIDFYCVDQDGAETSLNGETIPDTNKNIRDMFGSLEDFTITSLTPQFVVTNFIDARSTERKKYLSKLLDLDVFEQKHSAANDDMVAIKNKLKEYKEISFEKEIGNTSEELSAIAKSILELENTKSALEKELRSAEGIVIDLVSEKRNVPKFNNENIDRSIKEEEDKLKLLESLYDPSMVDFKRIEGIDAKILKLQKMIESAKTKLLDIARKEKEAVLLTEVPCKNKFPSCSFIVAANSSRKKLLSVDKASIEKGLTDSIEILKELREHKKESDIYNKNENTLLKIKNSRLLLDRFKKESDAIRQYAESIEHNKKIDSLVIAAQKNKEEVLEEIKAIEKRLFLLYKAEGISLEKLDNLKKSQGKIEELRKKYYIYQLYLQAVGKNGLSLKILNRKLPTIETEANRILAYIVDYKIKIKNNANNIDMYIVDPVKGTTPVELGSGSEKTLISLALRAVMWDISDLPKASMLVLDETFRSLQEDSVGLTMKMLSYLKNYFEYIFVISHDSGIKGSVDNIIYVDSDEKGYARVEN